MTIEIIIVHPPDYNEQANLPVVSLLSLRKKDGLSMGFKHNRVLRKNRILKFENFPSNSPLESSWSMLSLG